jgi:polyisoprenoid-binding protein YceI
MGTTDLPGRSPSASLKLSGNGRLRLRGVTRSLTFDVTATLVSETQLEGLGTTTIRRAEYGLLQGILADHGVSDEIRLEIEFVAREVKV